MGSALARGYERLTSDRDYLTCRVQMKLLGARQEELVERIAAGDGESAGGWRQVVALVASADAAMRVSPATPESARALSEAVRELLGQTRGRAGREEAFVELREIAGIWGRLSETEGRLAERNRAMLGVEQYLSMATAIGQLASRCIVMEAPADVRLREFVKGMGALTGGVRLTQPLLTAGMPA